MTAPSPNTAASVRQRLLNLSRAGDEEFQLVLSRYVRERFLYRLAQSEHEGRFVLKGATLFVVWTGEAHRVTRDLDLLGHGDPDERALLRLLRDVCTTPVPDDGVVFDAAAASAARIRGGQEYEGVRVKLTARLGSALVPLQVDVGFGDAVTPPPEYVTLPALLDFDPPRVRAYSRETTVAEKLQAMVQLGIANSRMKDYYDVWYLAQTFPFDGATLTRAIGRTFERRRTPAPTSVPTALSPVFAQDDAKRRQWRAFLAKGRLDAPGLEDVVGHVGSFALPPAQAVAEGRPFTPTWRAGGPWLPAGRGAA